jgi:hypothetical protein
MGAWRREMIEVQDLAPTHTVERVLVFTEDLGHKGSPRHRVLDIARLAGARGALRHHGLAETIPKERARFGGAG